MVAWFLRWLSRPEVDGLPETPPGDDALPMAHERGAGGGSGVLLSGHLLHSAGRLGGAAVLLDTDPTAEALTAGARRLVVKSKSGKVPSLSIERSAWNGKRWTAKEKLVVWQCGGVHKTKTAQTYEFWLSHRALGVPPFSKIALTSTALVGSKPLWAGVPPPEGQEPDPSKATDKTNPSSWTAVELR